MKMIPPSRGIPRSSLGQHMMLRQQTSETQPFAVHCRVCTPCFTVETAPCTLLLWQLSFVRCVCSINFPNSCLIMPSVIPRSCLSASAHLEDTKLAQDAPVLVSSLSYLLPEHSLVIMIGNIDGRMRKKYGFQMASQDGKGYRRVVASPQPIKVVEAAAIKVGRFDSTVPYITTGSLQSLTLAVK
jgi:hypothetical protein